MAESRSVEILLAAEREEIRRDNTAEGTGYPLYVQGSEWSGGTVSEIAGVPQGG